MKARTRATTPVPPPAHPVDPAPERPPGHSHRLDLSELQASGRFRRDSALGGMFHAGQVSLREDAPKGSMHISLGGGHRVSVHIDRYSPLAGPRRWGRSGYSVVRVVGHNVGLVADWVVLVVRRRWGEQRCELECERICDDEHACDETELVVGSPPAPADTGCSREAEPGAL